MPHLGEKTQVMYILANRTHYRSYDFEINGAANLPLLHMMIVKRITTITLQIVHSIDQSICLDPSY